MAAEASTPTSPPEAKLAPITDAIILGVQRDLMFTPEMFYMRRTRELMTRQRPLWDHMVAASSEISGGDIELQQSILRYGATLLEMAGRAEQAHDDQAIITQLQATLVADTQPRLF